MSTNQISRDALVTREKIERLAQGGKPRVFELCAGCGGSSLGFHREGYETVGSLEIDKHAAATLALNLGDGEGGALTQALAKPRDMTAVSAADVLAEFAFSDEAQQSTPDTRVDVLVAGLPCQAYSRAGRAKLRKINGCHTQDARGRLYERFLEYVTDTNPLAIVIENVPDMMAYGGKNIAEIVSEELTDFGYTTGYTILNSAHYGVPQARERLILIAVRNEAIGDGAANLPFPNPSHAFAVPRSLLAYRRHLNEASQGKRFWVEPFVTRDTDALPRAVTVSQALSDLPAVNQGESKTPPAERRPYALPDTSCSTFARLMRHWHGHPASDVAGHANRHTPRDYPIFAQMAPGEGYPQALKRAIKLYEETLASRGISEGQAEAKELRKQMVPPYDPSKFPNKWWKLDGERPSRTLTAHMGKDTYSHIHYSEPRMVTVREAARLQSFPDTFEFNWGMGHAFRQIGNAVPPLMAASIAKSLSNFLRQAGKP